jgi:hypothetical protein
MYPQAEFEIVINRQIKDVRPLKDHSYLFAQGNQVGIGLKDIAAVNNYLTLGSCMLNKVVHSVKASQECGLTAARRADDGSNILPRNPYVDLLQRQEIAIIEVQVE